MPFSLAGYMLGRAALSVSSLPLWAAFGSGLIAAVGALFWQRQTYVYNNELAYWTASNLGHIGLMALMWILATIAFLRLAVATFSGLRGTIIAKAITNLGKHTLEIYLVQGVAFTVVAALPPLSVERPTGYLIAVAVTAALVAGIPAVASHLRGHHVLDLLMWGRAKRG